MIEGDNVVLLQAECLNAIDVFNINHNAEFPKKQIILDLLNIFKVKQRMPVESYELYLIIFCWQHQYIPHTQTLANSTAKVHVSLLCISSSYQKTRFQEDNP